MKFLMSWKLTIKPGTTATPKIGNPVVSMRLASMSELGQEQTLPLFNHLVGATEQRLGNV
jgi:hypothetical protein